MAEYIEREAAIESLPVAYDSAINAIRSVPAADVAPVVHGEWETVDWLEYDAQSCEMIRCPEEGIACTRCRYVFKKDALWKRNSCPNCGARMDGDDDAEKD